MVRRYSAGGDALEVTSALGRRRQSVLPGARIEARRSVGQSGSTTPRRVCSVCRRGLDQNPKARDAPQTSVEWAAIRRRVAMTSALAGRKSLTASERCRRLSTLAGACPKLSDTLRALTSADARQTNAGSDTGLRRAASRSVEGCPPRACSRPVVQTTRKLSSTRRTVPTSPQKGRATQTNQSPLNPGRFTTSPDDIEIIP
jgi:hypothetical protein